MGSLGSEKGAIGGIIRRRGNTFNEDTDEKRNRISTRSIGVLGTSGGASAHNSVIHHKRQPRVNVELFGDSLALTLGFGLNNPALPKKYNYRLHFLGILGCGVVNGPTVMDLSHIYPTPTACNGETPAAGEPLTSQPWPVQWQAALEANQPNVAVLLAGRWEVADRVYMGQWTNILNPVFAAYVKQQLEMASNLVTATGANMVFLTSPCVDQGLQPDGAPWPADSSVRLSIYNQLVEQVAAEYPATDSVVDLNSIVCPVVSLPSSSRE